MLISAERSPMGSTTNPSSEDDDVDEDDDEDDDDDDNDDVDEDDNEDGDDYDLLRDLPWEQQSIPLLFFFIFLFHSLEFCVFYVCHVFLSELTRSCLTFYCGLSDFIVTHLIILIS